MLLAPAAPESVGARGDPGAVQPSLIAAPTSTITITVDQLAIPAVLSADWRRVFEVPPESVTTLSRGALPVRVAQLEPRPFTDRMVAEFGLPVDGWRSQTNCDRLPEKGPAFD